MPFCSNCGQQLSDNAKFCAGCGTPCKAEDLANNQRRTIYDGELHKCPNCGENITSFVSVCPSCGNELRGMSVSQSIKAFSEKLKKTNNIEQQVLLIRSYPIPNTKEDILEFMILTSTNISGDIPKSLLESWKAKFEQCYRKAELTFGNSNEFERIKSLYEQTSKKMNKAEFVQTTKSARSILKNIASSMPNPVFGIVCLLLMIYEIIRLLSGDFVGIDVIFCAIILGIVYKVTEKRTSKKETKAEKNAKAASTDKSDTDDSEKTKLKIPSAVRNGTSDNYAVFESMLVQAGFTNVKSIPLHDLAFGVIKKQGAIESIKINGKDISSYFVYKFVPDVPIIISYHSFR